MFLIREHKKRGPWLGEKKEAANHLKKQLQDA